MNALITLFLRYPHYHLMMKVCTHAPPPDILCTAEEVQHMLQKLDTGKANGSDAISARMLKHTASAIAPSVTDLSIHADQLTKD